MKERTLNNSLTLILFYLGFNMLSCAPKHETANLTLKYEPVFLHGHSEYTAERLLPVEFSNANFEFRVWINNSTPIDRVISVSKVNDAIYDHDVFKGNTKGYLVEMSALDEDTTSVALYKKTTILPKSGIDSFIAKVDSLKLFDEEGVTDPEVFLDQPYSIYIIELKEHGKYHRFRFYTNFPYKKEEQGKYGKIQNFIFSEFGQYFNIAKK